MFDSLRGSVLSLQPTRVVLSTGGIGWDLACSVNTSRRLGLKQRVRLYVHMNLVVNTSQISLYAFHNQAERDIFRQLITVSGIGPKVALAILSGMEVDELLRVLAEADTTRLTRVPGVGKKTAERLILELGEKLKSMLHAVPAGSVTHAPAAVVAGAGAEQEALEALLALGYKPAQAEQEVAAARARITAEGTDESVEAIVRNVLQRSR